MGSTSWWPILHKPIEMCNYHDNSQISCLAEHPDMYARYVCSVNTLKPRQNGRHFPDDIFKPIYLEENARISIQISLKFVPSGPVDNESALVQVMAWRRTGDRPLPESMLAHFTDAYMCRQGRWVTFLMVDFFNTCQWDNPNKYG